MQSATSQIPNPSQELVPTSATTCSLLHTFLAGAVSSPDTYGHFQLRQSHSRPAIHGLAAKTSRNSRNSVADPGESRFVPGEPGQEQNPRGEGGGTKAPGQRQNLPRAARGSGSGGSAHGNFTFPGTGFLVFNRNFTFPGTPFLVLREGSSCLCRVCFSKCTLGISRALEPGGELGRSSRSAGLGRFQQILGYVGWEWYGKEFCVCHLRRASPAQGGGGEILGFT